MSNSIKVGIIIGVVVLLVFGGWYVYKMRECVSKVDYTPSEEWDARSGGQIYSNMRKTGDYYTFGHREFKTSEDAIRACIWE